MSLIHPTQLKHHLPIRCLDHFHRIPNLQVPAFDPSHKDGDSTSWKSKRIILMIIIMKIDHHDVDDEDGEEDDDEEDDNDD